MNHSGILLRCGMIVHRCWAFTADVLTSSVLLIQLGIMDGVQVLTLQTRLVEPVAVGPKYGHRSVRHTPRHGPAGYRVDVIPNDFLVGSYPENPAWCTFADKGVTVRQTFCAADMVAVEGD